MMINNEVLTDIENQLNGIFSIVAPYVRILSAVRPFGNADASIATRMHPLHYYPVNRIFYFIYRIQNVSRRRF